MSRAELEAAAAEKYPITNPYTEAAAWATAQRAAYIQGRLDQAEADAQIAEATQFGELLVAMNDIDFAADARARTIAAAIRKGVE